MRDDGEESTARDGDERKTRRAFLKWLFPGLLAALGCTSYLTWKSVRRRSGAPARAGGLVEMRPLGRTGLTVSSLGMGDFAEAGLYEYGARRGLNIIETARAYDYGNSEANIGGVVHRLGRGKVILLTKFTPPRNCAYDKIMESVNKSLETLKVPSVDILLGHGVDDVSVLSHPNVLKAFRDLRKEGKVRLGGVSTHAAGPVLEWILKNGGYDVVLLPFHFGVPEEVKALISRAHDAGIGILGMKSTFLRFRPGSDEKKCSLTALRYAAAQKFIDSVLVRIGSYEQFDEILEALSRPLDESDLDTLRRTVEGPKLKDYRRF